MINSIIEMAHNLGLTVTAEGIEDQRTLAYLQKQNCDTAEGIYILRPIAVDNIEDWVAQHQDDQEIARLKAIKALNILDSAPEERFDRIIRLAQRIFTVPICTLSLIDQHRVWYKSKIGMQLDEIERQSALYEMTIHQNATCFVADALEMNKKQNPVVIGKPHVRFYVGQPIKAPNGVVIGSLCMFDFKPKLSCISDTETLGDLSAMIEDELANNSKFQLDILTQLKKRTDFDIRAATLLKFCNTHQLQLQVVKIKIVFDSAEQADIFNIYHNRAVRETARIIKNAFLAPI